MAGLVQGSGGAASSAWQDAAILILAFILVFLLPMLMLCSCPNRHVSKTEEAGDKLLGLHEHTRSSGAAHKSGDPLGGKFLAGWFGD